MMNAYSCETSLKYEKAHDIEDDPDETEPAFVLNN